MKQLLVLVLCVATLAPSIALAATDDDVSPNRRLTFSGTETSLVIADAIRTGAQSSTQQPANDEKLLGMHPALTISLFTAGAGAALGAFVVKPNHDADGNELPLTGSERARRALVGAGMLTGIFWLAGLAHR